MSNQISDEIDTLETEANLNADTGRYSKVDETIPMPTKPNFDKTTLMDETSSKLSDLEVGDEEKKLAANSTSEDDDDVKVLFDGKPKIVHKDHTNKWLVYNQYVDYGYRTNYNKNKILLKSACTCHNETANVWTHLLGAILFVGIVFYTVWFWTPMRLEHAQFKLRMKEKNWGDFVNANNYNDILDYFKAVTEDSMTGFRVYNKMHKLWENN